MVLTAAVLAAEAVTVITHLLSKGGEEAAGEAGKSLVGWIKEKLKGKGKEQQLETLAAAPTNEKLQGKLEGTLEDILAEKPELLTELQGLLEKTKAAAGPVITNSKNVNTGTIHAGRDVRFVDNSTNYNK